MTFFPKRLQSVLVSHRAVITVPTVSSTSLPPVSSPTGLSVQFIQNAFPRSLKPVSSPVTHFRTAPNVPREIKEGQQVRVEDVHDLGVVIGNRRLADVGADVVDENVKMLAHLGVVESAQARARSGPAYS